MSDSAGKNSAIRVLSARVRELEQLLRLDCEAKTSHRQLDPERELIHCTFTMDDGSVIRHTVHFRSITHVCERMH